MSSWFYEDASYGVTTDDNDNGGCSINSGDTAFMMFASTVVMMQTPAMGLAQAGMIRRKNSLSMLMQVLFGMVIGSLLWSIFGFSLSFGPSIYGYGLIGNPITYFGLRNVETQSCLSNGEELLADTLPGALFVAFHMMFALMTPLIVTGSWTEKLSFDAFLIFVCLWPIFVYYPLVHWSWNPNGWLNQLSIIDFAGGLVIHSSTGMAGFVISLMLQRRKQIHCLSLSHHNLPLSFVGAALVWSGWYSFNGGSALKANYQAGGALLNTHLSACAGALTWSILNYRHKQTKMWSLVECINGAFAGLGGITAGSGFVHPYAAILIGFTTSTASFHSVRFFKGYLRLDDVLDVTSLQGTAGIVGSLMAGLFATSDMQPGDGGGNKINGLFYGGGIKPLMVQFLGVVVTLSWSGTWTYVIVLIMKRWVGIDVNPQVEEQGLDLAQVGEQAYDQRLDLLHDIGVEALVGLLNESCKNGNIDDVKTLIVRQGADPELGDYDQRKPVHIAAAYGRLAILDYLYTVHGVDLNPIDKFGGTPLLDAIHNKHLPVIQFLKSNGGTIDTTKIQQEVFNACSEGNATELQLFLSVPGITHDIIEFIDYDHRTPLMVASSSGHIEIVNLLLKAGANINKIDRWNNTAYDSATLERHSHCAERISLLQQKQKQQKKEEESDEPSYDPNESSRLLAHHLKESRRISSINIMYDTKRRCSRRMLQRISNTSTATVRDLCTAASEGNIDELKRLIGKGADPGVGDYDHRTPLHLAAANGQLDAVKYLLTLDSVNVNAMDRYRHTPASEAARSGYSKITGYLRQNGAVAINPHLGYTLCSAAAEGNKLKLYELHSTQCCDLNTADYDSRTAMHLAASNGHVDVLQFLFTNGAIPNLKDRFGGTPLDDAIREGHNDAIEYLEKCV